MRVRPDLHAEPARLAPDEPSRRRTSSSSGERREEEEIGPVVCHALYLINLGTADETLWKKSRDTLLNTVGVACAIGADGVVLHVGSHLGAGFEAGLDRAAPALEEALAACQGPTWLLLENSAGTGATMGRSVDELAALFDRARRASEARPLPRLLPPLGVGNGRDRPGRRRRDARRRRPAHRPRPPPLPARERRRFGRSARTATVTRTSARARWAKASAPSSRTRASRGCRRSWRRPGPRAGPTRPRSSASGTCTPAGRALRGLVALLDDPEGRLPAGELEKLGIDAPELVRTVLVAARDLGPAHR